VDWIFQVYRRRATLFTTAVLQKSETFFARISGQILQRGVVNIGVVNIGVVNIRGLGFNLLPERMSPDAPAGTSQKRGVVLSTSWRRSLLCKFFHGQTGCLRKHCRFVHDIQTRVNELLDGEHRPEGVACLLNQACLLHDAAVDRSEGLPTPAELFRELTVCSPALVEHSAAVLIKDVLHELVFEVARETAAEAVTQAVTQHRTSMAATVSVIEAISIVEETNCAYLRESLLYELELSFARAARTQADGESGSGQLGAAETDKRVLAARAFEARVRTETCEGRRADGIARIAGSQDPGC